MNQMNTMNTNGKKRRWPLYLAGYVLIFAGIAAYLWLYYFPFLEDINILKREAVDFRQKIEDLSRTQEEFLLPDEKEKEFFSRQDRELRRKIQRLKGKEDFDRLSGDISAYLQELSRSDRVQRLEIEFHPEFPGKRLYGKVKYREMMMRFSTTLKNGLNFINHIPQGENFLGVDYIRLSTGEGESEQKLGTGSGQQLSQAAVKGERKPDNIFFTVHVRIYYISGKSNEKAEVVKDTVAGSGQPSSAVGFNLEIDFDSGVLLERVYDNLPGRLPPKEKDLPANFGNLF